ncbi:hypothetical protein IWQ62_006476, partial [Dispira parvispora]
TELEDLRKQLEDGEKMRTYLKDYELQNNRLQDEVTELKNQLQENTQRMAELDSDENIDRRIITNLLVTFLELPHGDTKRFEVLQLMSNILNFSTQEQERVGLRRSTVLSTTEDINPIDLDDESLTNQWISFLLKESNTRRHQSTPPES